MKRILFTVIAITIVVCGCNNSSSKKDKEIVVKETKPTEPDTAGYYAAREMQGIYEFKINKTTVKDLKGIENAISKLPHNYSCEIEKSKSPLFDKDYCDEIKEYDLSSLRIGDICFSEIHLVFFRDTLSFITCEPNRAFREAFAQKYGSGKVTVEKGIHKTGDINGKYLFVNVVWENEEIKADYYDTTVYKTMNGDWISKKYKLTISLKDPIKEKIIKDCVKQGRG